jgi:hypothetical protein
MRFVSIHEPAYFRGIAHRAWLGGHITQQADAELLLIFAHSGGDKGHAPAAIGAAEKPEP